MSDQNNPAGPANPEVVPAPVRKQRMGAQRAAAPVTGAPVAPVPGAPARPARQRMGAPQTGAPAPGASVPAPANPVAEAGSSPSVATAPPGAAAADPALPGTAAAGKTTSPAWRRHLAVTAVVVAVAIVMVLAARWLRTLEPVHLFITAYDGHASQPESTPEGIPAWLGWQHFFNMFLMVLIVRTGLQIRTERKPAAYWTARKDSFFSPKGNTPKKVSLTQWVHQSLDVLWVLNGLVFVVLLFATGQWKRIVPAGWDVFPHLVSTAIQYASLDWPTENGWVHYNALQLVSYFSIVFIAAPLAVLSGIRMSTWWPEQAVRLSKAYPVEWARAVHVPVMLYFLAFTVAHVFLVFFTGALRNLNHMYTSRDVTDWWGLGIFLLSLLVVAAGWFLTKPLFMRPAAARTGKVGK
ncbi:cytochrome b/b6 domain-containing protein [Arthrobacter sp. 3Tela_A]|uniref:cytochrome b/b6 domain-containing protein n=1 Tax=Arthrobacter sp. 3Tela_A TaxID=3093743 RepID=UPI003BB55717